MSIDQLFAGMATAEISGSGTYMEDGLYKIETKSIFVKKGVNPSKPGDSFVAEMKILESNNPAHPVGSTASYVLKFTPGNKYVMGNVVEFVMALLGYSNTKTNQADPEIRKEVDLVARAACGSEQAQKELGDAFSKDMLHGIPLNLEVRKKATAPKPPTNLPGVFTVHKWSPIAEVQPEALAAAS